jgi:hypothetical protein
VEEVGGRGAVLLVQQGIQGSEYLPVREKVPVILSVKRVDHRTGK